MHDGKSICAMSCLAVLALQLASICTTHWSVKKISVNTPGVSDKVDISVGLWKACGKAWEAVAQTNVDGCIDIPIEGWKSFPKNSLHVVRAFAIMGAVLSYCALMCSMYMRNDMCKCMCLVLGGVFSLIAISVWAGELLKLNINGASFKFDPGYSFWLMTVGGIISLLSGILHLVYTVRGGMSGLGYSSGFRFY